MIPWSVFSVLLLAFEGFGGAARVEPRSQAGVVIVVASGSTDAMREALRGLRGRLAQRGIKVAQEVHLGAAGEDLAALRQRPVDVVVAVGADAVAAAQRDLGQAAMVSSLVLDPAQHGASRATGVGLEFPLELQMQWIRRLLPSNVRRVGVVFNPAQNERTVARLREVARANDLEIIARAVTAPAEIPAALGSLTSAADVLWGIPDDVVMTTETARSILLFSLRNRLPLIGLSHAWVKAGALVALDRDYADIGAQCADQVWRILNGEAVTAVRPETPRRVVYAVNQRTAGLMNIRLSPETLQNAHEVVR